MGNALVNRHLQNLSLKHSHRGQRDAIFFLHSHTQTFNSYTPASDDTECHFSVHVLKIFCFSFHIISNWCWLSWTDNFFCQIALEFCLSSNGIFILQILSKQAELFGGDLLLSNQDELSQIRREMDGWTDCALEVFSRHRGPSGASHPNQKSLLLLNEVRAQSVSQCACCYC